jgi:hypothetical protein
MGRDRASLAAEAARENALGDSGEKSSTPA